MSIRSVFVLIRKTTYKNDFKRTEKKPQINQGTDSNLHLCGMFLRRLSVSRLFTCGQAAKSGQPGTLLSVLFCKQLTESKRTMIVHFCPFAASKHS